jgi:hypothetical protein
MLAKNIEASVNEASVNEPSHRQSLMTRSMKLSSYNISSKIPVRGEVGCRFIVDAFHNICKLCFSRYVVED